MNSFLVHYGISGQKWGVRRYQNEDGTLTEEGKRHYGYYDRGDGTKDMKRLNRDAEKDAREYARAKAYYGEGAGTRRKQIKNLISERMKDPDYKKAFEDYLGSQDMSAHQKAANRERHFQDAKDSTVRTVRGVKNFLLGTAVPVTTAALLIGGALKYTGAGTKIAKYGRTALSSVMSWTKSHASSFSSSASPVGNARSAFDAYMRGRG